MNNVSNGTFFFFWFVYDQKSTSYIAKMRGIFSLLDPKSIPMGIDLIEECLVDFGSLLEVQIQKSLMKTATRWSKEDH